MTCCHFLSIYFFNLLQAPPKKSKTLLAVFPQAQLLGHWAGKLLIQQFSNEYKSNYICLLSDGGLLGEGTHMKA